MYSLLKKIRQVKKGVSFLVIGLFITILFVFLLLLNHLRFIKINDTYKSFDNNSEYSLVLNKKDETKKYKLFSYQNYHFYGYGIKNISISYQNVLLNLEEFLKKEYLNIEEFFENSSLMYSNNNITKYYYDNCVFIVIHLFDNYNEVIISSN